MPWVGGTEETDWDRIERTMLNRIEGCFTKRGDGMEGRTAEKMEGRQQREENVAARKDAQEASLRAERRPAHAWLPALLKNAAAAAAYGLTCACTGMSVALMLTVDMWDMFLSLFDKLIFCANFTFKTVWHSLDPVTWTQAMAGARRTGSAGATC